MGRVCFDFSSVFDAVPKITLPFLFHNFFNGKFLIYHRWCVPFITLSKGLTCMWCHHRLTTDTNLSFIQNFCLQFPVSTQFSREVLQLCNLFQTPCTEIGRRLQFKSEELFSIVSLSYSVAFMERFALKRLIGRSITCFATQRHSFSAIKLLMPSSRRATCRSFAFVLTSLANKSSSSIISFDFKSFLSSTQSSRRLFYPFTVSSSPSVLYFDSVGARTSPTPFSSPESKLAPSEQSWLPIDSSTILLHPICFRLRRVCPLLFALPLLSPVRPPSPPHSR